jgi:hypothetical protein
MHAETLPYCASKLFKTITTDVSLSHLEKLQELARSNPELIRYIKTLQFAGDWGSCPDSVGTVSEDFT